MEKRYVAIEVFQGEESILRSRYAHLITTGGVQMYADGVKHAVIPVDSSDVSGAKRFDDAMKSLASLKPVHLEDVPE